jgi:hypothetical protein
VQSRSHDPRLGRGWPVLRFESARYSARKRVRSSRAGCGVPKVGWLRTRRVALELQSDDQVHFLEVVVPVRRRGSAGLSTSDPWVPSRDPPYSATSVVSRHSERLVAERQVDSLAHGALLSDRLIGREREQSWLRKYASPEAGFAFFWSRRLGSASPACWT